MEHLAIMNKSWDLTEKILSGEKTIESRWYKARFSPWDRITPEDIVYIKNSGEPVAIKASVDKVIQYSDLTPDTVKEILSKHGRKIGISVDRIPEFYDHVKEKKYCILVFLKNPQQITPFDIDKSGFGMMSAWITIDDINRIKR